MTRKSLFTLALGITGLVGAAASAAPSAYGNYSGTCQTRYGNATPGICPVTMTVDGNNTITVVDTTASCLSPTPFQGLFYGTRQQAQLQSAGWRAQPRGQVLTLRFRRSRFGFQVTGSGYGISDGKYTYDCSLQQQ